MLTEHKIRRIDEFTRSINLQFQKYSERPWGSFELIMSFDGVKWFRSGDLFGWGFDRPEVIALIFSRQIANPTFRSWLGPTYILHVERILQEVEENPIVPDKLLLPPTTN